MLTLDSPITLTPKAINSPNLCDMFEAADLERIGTECYQGYLADEQSRAAWLKRNEAGMDLALQIAKDKSFPWPGCANVNFPLVTIAAMQFHARAYPAIVNGSEIVKCATFGNDPAALDRSDRISQHMSWQLLYQDKPWEAQEDKAILNLSIVGTNFKKSYYSSSFRHNVSELVLAKDLVLDYWAKSVEDCPRKTHKIPMFRNEIYEKVMRGIYVDCLDEPWYLAPPAPRRSEQQIQQDNRQGITPPPPDDTTSLLMLEQHCTLDLDGDGYAEPYIVTLEHGSRKVLRIVTRFNSEADIERVASEPTRARSSRSRPWSTSPSAHSSLPPTEASMVLALGYSLDPSTRRLIRWSICFLTAARCRQRLGAFSAVEQRLEAEYILLHRLSGRGLIQLVTISASLSTPYLSMRRLTCCFNC